MHLFRNREDRSISWTIGDSLPSPSTGGGRGAKSEGEKMERREVFLFLPALQRWRRDRRKKGESFVQMCLSSFLQCGERAGKLGMVVLVSFSRSTFCHLISPAVREKEGGEGETKFLACYGSTWSRRGRGETLFSPLVFHGQILLLLFSHIKAAGNEAPSRSLSLSYTHFHISSLRERENLVEVTVVVPPNLPPILLLLLR